jgi:hypothetical protein
LVFAKSSANFFYTFFHSNFLLIPQPLLSAREGELSVYEIAIVTDFYQVSFIFSYVPSLGAGEEEKDSRMSLPRFYIRSSIIIFSENPVN